MKLSFVVRCITSGMYTNDRFFGLFPDRDTLRFDFSRMITHRIGGNLKLLRDPTNADRKRLKIAFSVENCRFRLHNLKRCFNA